MLLLHVGRAIPPADGWFQRLESLGAVIRADSLSAAWQLELDRSPRVTLLVQHYSDQYDEEGLARWVSRYPLTRCVVLRGPWVAGRAAYASQLRICRVFAWHDAAACFQTLECYARGESDWRDRQMGRDRCRVSVSDEPSTALRSAVFGTHDAHFFEALRDLVRPSGWELVRAHDRSVERLQPQWGMFDQWHAYAWHRTRAWSACRNRWAICDFPRPAERAKLIALGYQGILAKPLASLSWAPWRV